MFLALRDGSLPPVIAENGGFELAEVQRRLQVVEEKFPKAVWTDGSRIWQALNFDLEGLISMMKSYLPEGIGWVQSMDEMVQLIYVLSPDALFHLVRGLPEPPDGLYLAIKRTEALGLPPIADVEFTGPRPQQHPNPQATVRQVAKQVPSAVLAKLTAMEASLKTNTERINETERELSALRSAASATPARAVREALEARIGVLEDGLTTELTVLRAAVSASAEGSIQREILQRIADIERQAGAMFSAGETAISARLRDLERRVNAKQEAQGDIPMNGQKAQGRRLAFDSDDDGDDDDDEESDTLAAKDDPSEPGFYQQGDRTIANWRQAGIGSISTTTAVFKLYYDKYVTSRLKGAQRGQAIETMNRAIEVCRMAPCPLDKRTSSEITYVVVAATAGAAVAAKWATQRREGQMDPTLRAEIEAAVKSTKEERKGRSDGRRPPRPAARRERSRSRSQGRRPEGGRGTRAPFQGNGRGRGRGRHPS